MEKVSRKLPVFTQTVSGGKKTFLFFILLKLWLSEWKKSTAHSYCATFCTQLLRTPRLAGSGSNGSGNGGNNARLINGYARMLLG